MRQIFSNTYFENNHGEVNVTNYIQKNNSSLQFEEIVNLRAYTGFIAPSISTTLLAKIQQSRILILSISSAFDKDLYLRYLAASLSNSNNSIPAKEWASSNENNSLTVALKQETSDSIFIIDDIHPKDVNFDLITLNRIAQTKNAFILISTDVKDTVWKLDPAIQQMYWHELNNFYYAPNDLKKELGKALGNSRSLIFNKLSDQLKNSLLDEANLYKIGTSLGTPERIYLFVQYLSAHQSPITQDAIKEAVKMAIQQKDKIVTRTFDGLGETEKFVVLGLSFFDGCFDDQFFAAMKALAQDGWAIRNEKLQVLDYCDLDTTSNFFYFSEVGDDIRLVKTKFSELRHLLLEDNWSSFRRHLLMALSSISRLVIDSIDNQNSNWELYGTREKRQRLRVILGHTISDFGIHSPSSVQKILITLASHNDITIQRVAAKAMARWRQHGKDKLLFNTLEKWQGENRFAKLVTKILEDQGIKLDNNNSALNYIRATTVLALGYASVYDKPDDLSDEIIQFFEDFLFDTNKLVRNRIEFIIPQIVHHHTMKLYDNGNGLLNKLINHSNFIFPTALGLARALLDYPEKTRNLMHLWISNHRQHDNFKAVDPSLKKNKGCFGFLFGFSTVERKKDDETLRTRDRVIITLIFTCQQLIFLKDEHALVTSKSAIEILFDLRQTEQSIIIKELLFNILTSLMEENKPDIADILIKQLQSGEEALLIKSLGDRYLEERKSMTGGDQKLKLATGSCAIWIDSKRPDTYIEKLMKNWLIKGEKRQRQLAFKALIHFAKILNTYEAALIDSILTKRERQAEKMKEEARLKLLEDQKRNVSINIEEFKKAAISRLKRKWNLSGVSSKNKKILDDIYPVIEKANFEITDLETVANLLGEDNSIEPEISRKIRTLWKNV